MKAALTPLQVEVLVVVTRGRKGRGNLPWIWRRHLVVRLPTRPGPSRRHAGGFLARFSAPTSQRSGSWRGNRLLAGSWRDQLWSRTSLPGAARGGKRGAGEVFLLLGETSWEPCCVLVTLSTVSQYHRGGRLHS